jgi:ABC-type multidrug transport system fused ATPase/permease subunit
VKNSKNWFNRAQNLGLAYREIIVLIVLSLIAIISEIFGIGVFLPIFQYIRFEGDLNSLIDSSTLWQYVVNWFEYFSIKISLVPLLLIAFSLFLFRQIFTYLRLIYYAKTTERITQKIRIKMFDGYLDANTSYHDQMPIGSFVNLVTTEIVRAVNAVMLPLELVVYIVMMFGYMFVLMLLSWEMTILSIVVLLISALVPKIWILKSRMTGRDVVSANTSMSDFLIGRLKSPRLVRLSGTEIAEKKEFSKLTRAQRTYLELASILRAKTQVAMDPIVIGLSLLFLYFSYTYLSMQIEVLGLYLVIALRLTPVIKGILTQWQSIQTYLGSMEGIEKNVKIIEEKKEVDIGDKSLNEIDSLLIDEVSYHYPGRQDYVLKNITCEMKAGEMIAIVGPSGSGKSTLIDLLPSLRLPSSGNIKINGVNSQKYTLSSIRSKIAYASQFPQIFNGTIKRHILYGNMNASEEEMYAAAYLSGAEGFIKELPQGFDTIVGDDANKLSGGQKQRLDLARVLIKKSSVLILDEPTSNLDAKSEEIFKKTIDRVRKETNTLIIIVAHQLSSIVDADKIIVLNKGKIEDISTHEKLLDKDGWYNAAYQTQNQNK